MTFSYQDPLILKCKECVIQNIFEDISTGDVICANCGLILMDRNFDYSLEQRVFTREDEMNIRVEKCDDLSTYLTHSNFKCIKQLDNVDRLNLKFMAANQEIDDVCRISCLPPHIAKRCKQIYKQSIENKIFKHHQNECKNIVVAILFVVCKEYQIPRTFKELCVTHQLHKKRVAQAYWTLLRPNIKINDDLNRPNLITDSVHLLPRFCQHLHLPYTIQRQCIQLIEFFKNQKLFQSLPSATTASFAIFIMTNINPSSSCKRTFDELCVFCDVMERTLKNNYRKYVLPEEQQILNEINTNITSYQYKCMPEI